MTDSKPKPQPKPAPKSMTLSITTTGATRIGNAALEAQRKQAKETK